VSCGRIDTATTPRCYVRLPRRLATWGGTIVCLNMATQPVVDLAGTPFLDRLPRESREQVLVNSSRIRYSAGTIAFQAGDADRADILERGLARLYLTSAEGRQTTIRYVHPGELMGGLLVMGGVFDGSVQMLLDSAVIHLDLLTVRRRVEVDPALGNALAADLAQRYSHCVRTIAMHAFGSVVQRVAFDLLDRACRTQLSGGQLEAAVSQQEIADGIGSARPVVANALTTIRTRRLVDTARRRVRIVDPTGLEALAFSGLL
jgi:CRP/FNR family transcriptional regulator, cyclic AMP receptor protein